MRVPAKTLTMVVSSSLLLGMLSGCNKTPDTQQQSSAPLATASPAPYTPPTAEQLSQMVAPIALFPDKLLGQVLAGATYPAQISAADQWLAQNPTLKGDALQSAEANQPWDVSVKGLTAFPSVLDQMAGNIQWTTSLGQAYANDPTDVMNAIQLLRQRAQQAGTLKSSQHLIVSTRERELPPRETSVTVVDSEPHRIVMPPKTTIIIEPAEPDVVYVPHYNPAVVYGAPVAVYPGWVYREPVYTHQDLVTTGALSFGVGVLVGAMVDHHSSWGWNAWGVDWGSPMPHPGYGGGWRPPAVVYNNNTYVTKSVSVVNRVNNVNVTNNNYRVTNNIDNHNRNINVAPAAAPLPAQQANRMMSMPHFTPRDMAAGARPLAASSFAPPHQVAPQMRHAETAPAQPSFRQERPMLAHQQSEAQTAAVPHEHPPVERSLASSMAPAPAFHPQQHDQFRDQPHDQPREQARLHTQMQAQSQPVAFKQAPSMPPAHMQPQHDRMMAHQEHPHPAQAARHEERHAQHESGHGKHEGEPKHG